MLHAQSLLLLVFLTPAMLSAQTDIRSSTRLNSADYFYGSYGPNNDEIFDRMTIVDLSADLGVGSDCGKINVSNTLRASLGNIIDDKYFQKLGQNIVASSGMLLTCYLSPTWCSILKSSRLEASNLMQTRLSQCGMIDKYIDSRTEEYGQARQTCVRKEIDRSGGDFEAAMESCQSTWDRNLTDWSGDNKPETTENRVIDSSAKWAGSTNTESQRIKKLLISMVGDTVVKHGAVTVDYGPEHKPSTPRSYLTELESENHQKLCGDLLRKINNSGGSRADVNRIVTDQDIQSLSADSSRPLVDRQTISSLSVLPDRQRELACRKLSESVSMTMFASDMNKTLDFMTATVMNNPHLPDNRRLEAERKRQALKDQIELTLSLNKHKNEPLNEVLTQINESGARYRNQGIIRALESDEAVQQDRRIRHQFMDCADGHFCNL